MLFLYRFMLMSMNYAATAEQKFRKEQVQNTRFKLLKVNFKK